MSKQSCHRKECMRIRSEFSVFLSRRRPPQYEGNIFCSDSCLWAHVESELSEKWQRVQLEKDRRIPRPKLGTILMNTARITRDQIEEAVRLQSQNGEGRIGEWLLRLGFVEERQITAALALQYGLPVINLKNSSASRDALRMIPGIVAKHSSLIPVGFDDNQRMLRVAVTPPVNFNSQEAIRRMVRKGMVTYVGDQSVIQQLLEQWYEPDDPDVSSVPTYSSKDELIAIGNEIIAAAINQHAQDIQAELLHDFFWVRLDFPSESHHHFFRYESASAQNDERDSEKELAMSYAIAR